MMIIFPKLWVGMILHLLWHFSPLSCLKTTFWDLLCQLHFLSFFRSRGRDEISFLKNIHRWNMSGHCRVSLGLSETPGQCSGSIRWLRQGKEWEGEQDLLWIEPDFEFSDCHFLAISVANIFLKFQKEERIILVYVYISLLVLPSIPYSVIYHFL